VQYGATYHGLVLVVKVGVPPDAHNHLEDPSVGQGSPAQIDTTHVLCHVAGDRILRQIGCKGSNQARGNSDWKGPCEITREATVMHQICTRSKAQIPGNGECTVGRGALYT